MKMRKHKTQQRQGFSLLEMIVTTAMLAAISTSSVVLVRTAYTAWSRHEEDNSQRRAASAALRHISRSLRQATAVIDISSNTESSGWLSIVMPSGDVRRWEHDNTNKQILYGFGAATEVLADNIEQLFFYGYNTNMGITAEPGLIHSVVCSARTDMDRPAGADAEVINNAGFLRSW